MRVVIISFAAARGLQVLLLLLVPAIIPRTWQSTNSPKLCAHPWDSVVTKIYEPLLRSGFSVI